MLMVIAITVLTNVAFLLILPPDVVASSKALAIAAGEKVLGRYARSSGAHAQPELGGARFGQSLLLGDACCGPIRPFTCTAALSLPRTAASFFG